MPGQPTEPNAQPLSRLTLAHVACLCLGIACICWGIAPAVVERVVSGRAPRLATVASGSLTVVVGILFLVLHVYVRRGRRWAMWTALCAAIVIFGFSVPSIMGGQGSLSASFLPLFAVCVAMTNWFGLKVDDVQRAEEQAAWKQSPGVSHLQPLRKSPIFSRPTAADAGRQNAASASAERRSAEDAVGPAMSAGLSASQGPLEGLAVVGANDTRRT